MLINELLSNLEIPNVLELDIVCLLSSARYSATQTIASSAEAFDLYRSFRFY
jgi:hypothetical protein